MKEPLASPRRARPASDTEARSSTIRAWLRLVGIGEDGAAGLGESARAAIAGAKIVYGGSRHLALAGDLITGQARPWPPPLEGAIAEIVALRGTSVCVLASGDPLWFGVGARLLRAIPADEMAVCPSPSAFQWAAARLGWPLQDTITLSLHARTGDGLFRRLDPGARLLALTTDGAAPGALAAELSARGLGGTKLTVLEALGGPRERSVCATADTLAAHGPFDPLNVLAVEIAADAPLPPRTIGLDDALFQHDGQLTKRAVRAVTLAMLAPRPGELLWDVGLGAGSVAIEWLRAHPDNRAIGIERDPLRANRARANAKALHADGLHVVEGQAPRALADLPPPDAVFIGGGAGEAGVLDLCRARLRPGGRLVVNAVTLETEALLIGAHAAHGGTLLRLGVEHAEPVGRLTGWRPAMTVTQWSLCAP